MDKRLRNAAGAGATCALLLGTGLVARVGDLVRSDDNQLHAPALPASAIEVAHTSGAELDPTTCIGWTDDTTSPMVFDSIGTVDGEVVSDAPVAQWDNFCVRNVSDAPIAVATVFRNVLSTELGCGPHEEEVDDDCTLGAPGELNGSRDLARYPLYVDILAADGPLGSHQPFATMEDLPGGNSSEFTLQPGETTVLYFQFTWADQPGGFEELVWSQSDRLQWDLDFEVVEF